MELGIGRELGILTHVAADFGGPSSRAKVKSGIAITPRRNLAANKKSTTKATDGNCKPPVEFPEGILSGRSPTRGNKIRSRAKDGRRRSYGSDVECYVVTRVRESQNKCMKHEDDGDIMVATRFIASFKEP